MRRTIWLLAGVLLCVVALGSDSPKEYDDKVKVNTLEGAWWLTREELNGNKLNSSEHEMLIYYKGTFTRDFGDGKTKSGSGRIETTYNPPHLDWILANGDIKYIYQIDGDTLRLASKPGRLPGETERPQGFNDKGLYVCTYKRVK